MIKVLLERFRQRYRTSGYPKDSPALPDRFQGAPALKKGLCAKGCNACADVCPTEAIPRGEPLRLDLGKCLFCGACERACPAKAVSFGRDHRLAVRRKEDFVLRESETLRLADALDKRMRTLFGRSLKLRQVSAGGCNACEADTNVLNTLTFDLGRFGIQFVASPRHADGLLITGPVTLPMKTALQKTYNALPWPSIVIAVGACAVSGGPYAGHPEVLSGADAVVPVDLFVAGCPPHPYTILDGILRLIGRIKPPS